VAYGTSQPFAHTGRLRRFGTNELPAGDTSEKDDPGQAGWHRVVREMESQHGVGRAGGDAVLAGSFPE
jgi:hypothetical protein